MLSNYHQKYVDQPDEELQKRIDAKETELVAIRNTGLAINTPGETIEVCIMGCGDKRFINGHALIFEKVFGRPADITTLDITTDHLAGGEKVFEHDITNPLPGGPYDVTYAHVVLKFIDESKHWQVVENSFSCLKPGGMAIHVLDEEDYADPEKIKAGGQHPIDLEEIKTRLQSEGIEFHEVIIEYGLALVLVKH